jgi:hypothetical protein
LIRHLGDLGQPLPVFHPVELVWRSIQQGLLTPEERPRSAASRPPPPTG